MAGAPPPASRSAPRARGATSDPPNRFERFQEAPLETLGVEPDPVLAAEADEAASDPRTRFLRDSSRRIVATNQSPDVGFDASVNPYRGCEHGCIYCYARPTHEYLGFSAGLDFETRILVKEEAPALLRRALSAPAWKPQVVALSGVTDPYQPIERRLALTRRCLEVLLEFRNPVALITKNRGVLRDLDLLRELARFDCVSVSLSVTTLDVSLQRVMEPRTSRPRARLSALRRLREAGIPAGVMVAPVIPGLTDHEIPAIVEAAGRAGASHAGWVLLRLPHGVKTLFEEWLERHFPARREKVLARMRALSSGKLYESRFGKRQRGEGAFAAQIEALFALACRRAGIPASQRGRLATRHFRRPGDGQLDLFDVAPPAA